MRMIEAVLLLMTAAVISGFVFALPVMLLWDWLMPTLFGLPELTWLQAWALLILCGLLFKGHSAVKG